jgi:hypothetical protein
MFLPEGTTADDFIVALASVKKYITRTEWVAVKKAAKDALAYPTPKNPIKGINPLAYEKHWKEFCTKYSKVWRKYEGEDAWACCVAIWRNYCLKRKIMPFDTTAQSLNKDTRKTLADRIKGARQAQLDRIETLLTKGIEKEVIKGALKESFVGIGNPKPGVFTATTRKKLKLVKGITFASSSFSQWLLKAGFTKARGKYTKNLRAGADIIVYMDEGDPFIYLLTTITRPHLQYLLDTQESDATKLTSQFAKYWKVFYKKTSS